MEQTTFRLRISLAIFLVTMLLGTGGFMLVEGLSLGDAFYFNIVTMATVGYGDIHPVTPTGKLLAILLIVLGTGTFLGVVANATEIMLSRRESRSREKKLHIIIGVYFSELGTRLLAIFAAADPDIETMRQDLMVENNWSDREFQKVFSRTAAYRCRPEINRVNLPELRALLVSRRNTLVDLLEHPILLEQESFTEHLQAVFHLTEELTCRPDFIDLPATDLQHLTGDMHRAYSSLVQQWIAYMKYLKFHYPYLFSLALRTNPFDPAATPVVL
ncbi:MAG: ion transporter [Deltaproteobacteria bacterium RIFOXYD12_FULL_57_12]|nr:MAG: ion transporter [Deltaproteobacteria bacterium RIFOXYD12_FULL_57_12]